MFGKNPIRHRHDYPANDTYRVQSIFTTIQGEGPFAGNPAIFIRLAGCNLACHFCDTDFDTGWHNIMDVEDLTMSVEQSLQRSPTTSLIVITGGEPMLQRLGPLVRMLSARVGRHIQIETAGTVWDDTLDGTYIALRHWDPSLEGGVTIPDVSIVVSPKTPRVHSKIEQHAIAWKYIVRSEQVAADGLPVDATYNPALHQPVCRPPSGTPPTRVFVQAMDQQDIIKNAANLKEAARQSLLHGYRLSVQLHKIVGLE